MSGRRVLVATGLALALAALLAGPSGAEEAGGGPFYFAPPPTHECQGVPNCLAAIGPWVAIPAHGEATFLMSCPTLFGYLIGGTDARASAGDVRVWFDGSLGAPIGKTGRQGALLLFHAVTSDGQPGSFQPILGCASLVPKNKVSTLVYLRSTATPGTAPSGSELRSRLVVVRPFRQAGYRQPGGRAAACPANQTLVGSWDAIGFKTSGPPSVPELASIRATLVVRGNAVKAFVERLTSNLLPVSAELQYGAICES